MAAVVLLREWRDEAAGGNRREYRLRLVELEPGAGEAAVTRADVLLWSFSRVPPSLAVSPDGARIAVAGNAARAVRDLDAAIRIAPNDAEAFNLRGDAAVRMGDLTRALEDYSAAVRLNPFYGLAFRNRGRVYFYRGDFAAAAEDFAVAAEAGPTASVKMTAARPKPRRCELTSRPHDRVATDGFPGNFNLVTLWFRKF